jgi:hypothetical protein
MGGKMASWKRFERYVAAQLKTKRIPILGREGADIASNRLWIDCKKRQQVPAKWEYQLSCAEALGHQAVLVTYNSRDLVAMRLDYFTDEPAIPEYVLTHADLPETPIKWLLHIEESCPEGHLPMVVMIKPGQLYRNSIVLVDLDQYLRWRNDDHQSQSTGTGHPAAAG